MEDRGEVETFTELAKPSEQTELFHFAVGSFSIGITKKEKTHTSHILVHIVQPGEHILSGSCS